VFIKLRSTPFKDGATLVPKLANLLSTWKSGSTPLYSGSSILDPDQLSFCTIYTCQLDEFFVEFNEGNEDKYEL
jgi:hypothetical protein